MNSREQYEKSYNYMNDLQKGLTGTAITIDFTKLDEVTAGEVRDLLNRCFVRRKGTIFSTILNGAHNGYFD